LLIIYTRATGLETDLGYRLKPLKPEIDIESESEIGKINTNI